MPLAIDELRTPITSPRCVRIGSTSIERVR
jgi:hypothetical protein